MFKNAVIADVNERKVIELAENAKIQPEIIKKSREMIKSSVQEVFIKSILNNKPLNIVSAPDKIKPYGQKPPSNGKQKAKGAFRQQSNRLLNLPDI